MTLVIKQHTENGFHVVMEWDKTNIYRVMCCQMIDECTSGYIMSLKTYSISDKKNAEATFRRYVKKYCKGE